jgi:hypothetical protein
MSKALILAAFILPSGTKITQPPVNYQKDTAVRIEFLSEKAVQKKCQRLTGDREATACASVELMTMPLACENRSRYAKLVCSKLADKDTFVTFPDTLPNPCTFKGGGQYANLMCHELGHVNGWPPKHPRK